MAILHLNNWTMVAWLQIWDVIYTDIFPPLDCRGLLWADSAACLGPARIIVNANAASLRCTATAALSGTACWAVRWEGSYGRRGVERPLGHSRAPLSGRRRRRKDSRPYHLSRYCTASWRRDKRVSRIVMAAFGGTVKKHEEACMLILITDVKKLMSKACFAGNARRPAVK